MKPIQVTEYIDQIQKHKRYGDYETVADLCNCSPHTVRSIIDGKRKDRKKVFETFLKLIQRRVNMEQEIKEENQPQKVAS